ncbi:CDP-glucose 4,6-dehydratase [Candidatus Pelagibacter sp.]|uniref:CDP-glucose 4,6-dehydratase n=1 Tax=Candidatus Pelagibacter sp. TaxID=2024849 RepID=UPI003F834492
MKLLKKFYKNKKVLITGATGFKGAWLSLWLKILGAKVYAIGYSPNKNKKLFFSLNLQKKIKIKTLDIRNYKKLKLFIQKIKPELIFHMAAQPLILDGYKKPYFTYEVNTLGTLNILEASRNVRSIKSLICVTSDKCYESNYSTIGFKENDKLGGIDPYSGSKASAEIIINTYFKSYFGKEIKFGIASARAGNVIGGGDQSPNRLIPDLVNSLNKNKKIILRNPDFNRPWQHVLEPLYGYLILGINLYKFPKKFSGPWNFGTEKNTVTSVLKIVKIAIKKWGYGELKIRRNKKIYEQTNLQLNIDKAKKILKWKPKYKIKESVELTIDWYKKVIRKKYTPEQITKKNILEYMNSK